MNARGRLPAVIAAVLTFASAFGALPASAGARRVACSQLVQERAVEIALGPTWSADGGCGRTAAWNSASHTWILGKQQWFVDSSAPSSRTSVYLFPTTIAITQLYATRRAGLKQVSRKPRMILARDSHPVPGQYAWSGFATGAGGTRFVVSGLPSAAAVKTFIALQRRQLSL